MAKNTIKITNYSKVHAEYEAASAITPGMLIELTSAGKVQAHANSGQSALPMFATEDDLQGNTIDDNYSSSDKVQCWIPGRGDIVYAIVADDTAAISIGDKLESNGDGNLKKYVADTVSYEPSEAIDSTLYSQQIVGVALEAVDTSGSSGEESSGPLAYDKRIQILVI